MLDCLMTYNQFFRSFHGYLLSVSKKIHRYVLCARACMHLFIFLIPHSLARADRSWPHGIGGMAALSVGRPERTAHGVYTHNLLAIS